MRREFHVRFCEGLGVQFPRATRLVLLAPDPETLTVWREEIRAFVAERLRLKLRADGDEPFPVSRGIDFAGWKTWATHRVPRRRTLAALGRRLREAERALVARDEARGAWSIDLTVRSTRAPGAAQREIVAVDAMLSMLASYSGHLRWGGSWTAWHGIWNRHPWLAALCACDGWDASLRWTPRASRQPRLWQQYWALASAAAPRTLVFCRVGAFVEFRGPFVSDAAAVLGLQRVRLHRGQWAFGAGFPVCASRRYEKLAVARGRSVAVVREGDWRGHRACRAREVVRILGRPAAHGSA